MAEYVLKVTTTGSAGSATGSASTEMPIRGAIWEIKIDYHASAPNTTTVDIDEVDGMARKILDLAGANTDAVYRPRQVTHTNTGTAGTAYTEPFLITNRRLTVSVAASDALTDAVVVTLIVLEL